jgi:tRNA U34 2-thiouridine synthase MnmA/TrmU
MCNQIGVELEILDLRELYLDEVLFNPKYGYGKNFILVLIATVLCFDILENYYKSIMLIL